MTEALQPGMNDSIETKVKRDTPRDLFVELSDGMKALIEERVGKRKLRTHVQNKPDEPSNKGGRR